MDTSRPAPPPLRMLQSRARPAQRPAAPVLPAPAWWQRLLPWSASHTA